MPKQVDHDERRADICNAALAILARSGPKGLTVRAVAKELGSSTGLVTHYFRNKHDLYAGLAAHLDREWTEETAAIAARTQPGPERLLATLIWMLPIDQESRTEEAASITLIALPPQERLKTETLSNIAKRMRSVIADALEGCDTGSRKESLVDLLRVFTQGLTIEALRYPWHWPGDRQIDVLRQFLTTLGLLPETK